MYCVPEIISFEILPPEIELKNNAKQTRKIFIFKSLEAIF